MRRTPAISLTAILLSLGFAAAAELPTPPVSVVALSGERIRVGQSFSLNPDCTPQGPIKARLAEAPKNGMAEIVNEKGFSTFGNDDQKYKCNEKETDVVAYYYKSEDGFKGKDRFVIEVFYHNGNFRKHVYNVDVR